MPLLLLIFSNEDGITVHTEHENKVNAILRSFDLLVFAFQALLILLTCWYLRTYKFGPCVGIPRIARWNRAQANGLNPPPEVSFEMFIYNVIITDTLSGPRDIDDQARPRGG